MENITQKIKEKKLLGRSGSMFPVALKWETVKSCRANKKYVVCNASEGELETFKDHFLLKNHAESVIDGIKTAVDFLEAEKGYIYLNKDYYDELYLSLIDKAGEKIEVIKKRGGYVGGEETSVIEAIEGCAPEPRVKPPFPAENGLWGYPTLVNNVETFYCVSKIKEGSYENSRFYSIGGDAPNKGVFQFREDITVKELLNKTNNNPSFDYFLQVGGGACGKVFLPEETEREIEGLGSIVIYDREETDPYTLMKKWVDFLLEGNCDKCTPCREGLYRIMEMIEKRKFNEVEDIFFVMEKTSLCPLGKVAVNPFKSLLDKIIFSENGSNN